MEYNVIYTNRKSIGIYIRKDGSIEVRCPKYVTKKTIEDILVKKHSWIENTRKKVKERKDVIIDDKKRLELINKAKEIVPNKVRYFSKIMGVVPKGIRIGNAKSYWGFCSGDNRLNFSWRLMMMEDKVIDYVVVHELAHIKEHNHSKRFWNEVGKIIPDYKVFREKLKKCK